MAGSSAPLEPAANTVTRHEVEDFLYEEAALLDEWRLDEWVTLFTEDARYVVPPTDLPDADPRSALVLIDDDIIRLRERVIRLNSRRAHREFPYSRTRRLITNVRIRSTIDNNIHVNASFVVYRFRNEQADQYVGRYEYVLSRIGRALKIRHRKAILDLMALQPVGPVSIIL
jgi:p-cumate 2,3-dioxygenase beta subunit